MAFSEGLAAFAFTIVFRKGLAAFVNKKSIRPYNNEEMVSVSVLLAIIYYGLADIQGAPHTIQIFACLFTILFIGYKYGAGYGAIIGVTCGITMSLLSGAYSFISIFCLLGVLAGSFREFGKVTASVSFLIGALVLTGLAGGMPFNFEIFGDRAVPVGIGVVPEFISGGLAGTVLPLIAGSVLFMVLPESITYKIYNNDIVSNDSFTNQNIQVITQDKLKEFSGSFHNLARTFAKMSSKKIKLEDLDKEDVFNDLSEELCMTCKNCILCWEEHSDETFEGINHIMEGVELDGTITTTQVPQAFRNRCIKLEGFIAETIRIFDLAKLKISCNNKLLEGREAISDQFSQIAHVLDDYANNIYKYSLSSKEAEKRTINSLRTHGIIVDNIAIFEKYNYRKEIFIYAHIIGGHCVTTKDVSQVISSVVNKKMLPSEKSKAVITKASEMYIFEEDVNYKVLTGVSRIKKDGSLVSGDNYSFIRPESGTAVMTLSDGMGTGEDAYRESEAVINLLEEFIEAGFSKDSAIKLINSVMLLKSSHSQIYSTLDMSLINLYTGMCDFIKLGASTTFIKHGDDVEIVQSNALPIGMVNQIDYEVYSKQLKDGDFIIMVTDGIIDSLPIDEKEELMQDFIARINMNNPKKVANAVLNYSLECNNWVPKDDMTVLVGGFWESP